MTLGSAFPPRPLPAPPRRPSAEEELYGRVLAALEGMRVAIDALPRYERQQVEPVPVDLTRVVQAVTDLGGSFTAPSAEQIAEAIGRVLQRSAGDKQDSATTFELLAKVLDRIDKRIMGMANQVYGGGVVTLSDQAVQHLASQIATAVSTPGSLQNGTETTVTGSATLLVAANTTRKALLVQNTGTANMRVGAVGVTATTGFRLVPGGHLIVDTPTCTNAVYAIREGSVSTIGLAQEIV